MSPQAARKPSLYEQLAALPEGLTGEIINGQLRTQPRPSWAHGLAASRLGADLDGPYGRGRGGPGGWWIIDEPEVHFILDTEVVVPDIAGWRRERMPSPPHSLGGSMEPNRRGFAELRSSIGLDHREPRETGTSVKGAGPTVAM